MSLLTVVGGSLLFSLAICFGADPSIRDLSDEVCPLAGIFVGAAFLCAKGKWKTGLWIPAGYVAAWLAFWLYSMGRWNLLVAMHEGASHFDLEFVFWWALAILAGLAGDFARVRGGFRTAWLVLGMALILACLCGRLTRAKPQSVSPIQLQRGVTIDYHGPARDQTDFYALSFESSAENPISIGIYDCDSDDAVPFDDKNTSYLGQGLAALTRKLDRRASVSDRRVVCLINGGFFGAFGWSVAHHEEPMVISGRAHYDVDLLRPKDQAWFFAVRAGGRVEAGGLQFELLPTIEQKDLENYSTVLGGVRPLRVNGVSVPLKPGAGATSLRCSRTSIGWSKDCSKFYILVVRDCESEAASQFQRRMGWKHWGGWDVPAVQRYWESKNIPNAALLDGGESTQLAYWAPDGGMQYVSSGYEYSYTLGYLRERPLSVTLPMLPPALGHRGVLNYLYVEAPRDRGGTWSGR